MTFFLPRAIVAPRVPAPVGEMGMATAPVVCLATWALFGIQEIGLLIEDPFQVRNLSGLLIGWYRTVPHPHHPVKSVECIVYVQGVGAHRFG